MTENTSSESNNFIQSEFTNLGEQQTASETEQFAQIKNLTEKMIDLTETIESMKGEILEEINLSVKENYKLSVMDDKINSLQGEVNNMRSDIQQMREEFMNQTQALQILLLELPEKLKNQSS